MATFYKLVFSILLAIPSAFFIFVSTLPDNFSELTIVNNSGLHIKSIYVELGGERKVFSLEKGAVLNSKIIVACECHYEISSEFSDGRRISLSDGYLTAGFNYKDKITIMSDRMTLDSEVLNDGRRNNDIAYGLSIFVIASILFYIILPLVWQNKHKVLALLLIILFFFLVLFGIRRCKEQNLETPIIIAPQVEDDAK